VVTVPSPIEEANRVYALAARFGVGIGEACDRAGIDRSTPPRWRKGTQPRPQQVSRLRHAIMDLARERGHPVNEVLAGLGIAPDGSTLVDLQIIREAVDRLEVAFSRIRQAS
jgi:hypothetical protein